MIFGLFKTNREVKEHCTCLMQFLELLAYTYNTLGPDAVFHIAETSELVAESNETTMAGNRSISFVLAEPVNEFQGTLEGGPDGELVATLHGRRRYAGLMVQSIGVKGRLQVAVNDGLGNRATTRAMWMSSHFVSFGAKDISSFLRKMS